MRIDNRTTWDTAALEQLIRAALDDAGVKPGHDLVKIVYARNGLRYGGWCYYGGSGKRAVRVLGNTPRMRLILPRADHLDVARVAYLVRHECAHWAGLTHKQMSGRLMTPPKAGDTLPTWVPEGWSCGRVEPPAKPPVDREAKRNARRQHIESKVADYERKLARYERLLAKWRRKLTAHDTHYKRAALKGKS